MGRSASPGADTAKNLFSPNTPASTPPGRAISRGKGDPMKSVLIAAALIAGAVAPSFAKTVRIPVSRGAGGVPVPCDEDPLRTCHNRWHPEIPDAAEADPGDTVIFETRDAFDNPFNRRSTRQTVAAANLNLIHPLTGPLHVRGAKRGDVLAVTMIDVGPGPDNFGYTVAVPGFGFLRDVFTDPAIVHWDWARRRSTESATRLRSIYPGCGCRCTDSRAPSASSWASTRSRPHSPARRSFAPSKGSCFLRNRPTRCRPVSAAPWGRRKIAACAPSLRART